MTDLQELLDRVKAATGPDREIDFLVERFSLGDIGHIIDHWNPEQKEGLIPRFTASIDEDLALTERVLPGCGWYVAKGVANGVETIVAGLYPSIHATETFAKETGATAPLAILAATLSALIAMP